MIVAREPALGIRRAVGIGEEAEHGRARAAHDRAERAAVEQAALDGRDLALAVGEHVLKNVVHPALAERKELLGVEVETTV